MTKAIRIENADNSDYRVIVQTWERGKDLGNGNTEPDILVDETYLSYPTEMAELSIWSNRYLVIREA